MQIKNGLGPDHIASSTMIDADNADLTGLPTTGQPLSFYGSGRPDEDARFADMPLGSTYVCVDPGEYTGGKTWSNGNFGATSWQLGTKTEWGSEDQLKRWFVTTGQCHLRDVFTAVTNVTNLTGSLVFVYPNYIDFRSGSFDLKNNGNTMWNSSGIRADIPGLGLGGRGPMYEMAISWNGHPAVGYAKWRDSFFCFANTDLTNGQASGTGLQFNGLQSRPAYQWPSSDTAKVARLQQVNELSTRIAEFADDPEKADELEQLKAEWEALERDNV